MTLPYTFAANVGCSGMRSMTHRPDRFIIMGIYTLSSGIHLRIMSPFICHRIMETHGQNRTARIIRRVHMPQGPVEMLGRLGSYRAGRYTSGIIPPPLI